MISDSIISKLLLALTVAAWCCGCAPKLQLSELRAGRVQVPARGSVDDVPFFAQREHHCGPATLAMVLGWAGRNADPAAIAPLVFSPALHGSLNLDMVGGARRLGMLAYQIRPRLDVLLGEIHAGNPVIVLQNLGSERRPVWHFAVAVGYDLDTEEIVLRSGNFPRLTQKLAEFERSWARAQYWALLVLPPARFPAFVQRELFLQAAYGLELAGRRGEAIEAYRAALDRWPHDELAVISLSNALYTEGNRGAAIEVLRRAATGEDPPVAVLNNLAHMLAEAGRRREARAVIARALPLCGELREMCERTRDFVEGKR